MAIDYANLSSNWKRLQQSFDHSKDGHTPQAKQLLKRKALNELHKLSKRKKVAKQDSQPESQSSKLPQRDSSNMGSYSSAPRAPTPPPPTQPVSASSQPSAKDASQAGKYIALDCEMVGIDSHTPYSIPAHHVDNEYSILARVSVVAYDLTVTYDAYVLPPQDVRITDYRTKWSGITPWHLNPKNETTSPRTFERVQRDIATLLQGRILVGHAIRNDLEVLGLSHPRRDIRDTASYAPFRKLAAGTGRDGRLGKPKTPALRMLAREVLGREIQADEAKGHDSVEDARATMELFQHEKKGFEEEVIKMFGRARGPEPDRRVVFKQVERAEHEENEGDSESGEDDEGQAPKSSPKRKKKKKKKKGKYRR